MATISLISGTAMYFLINNAIFVQTIGFVALLTEAGLGLPQLYRNHVNKSTVGMNSIMVLLWLAGDVFKTIYYIVNDETPIQVRLKDHFNFRYSSITHSFFFNFNFARSFHLFSFGSVGSFKSQ